MSRATSWTTHQTGPRRGAAFGRRPLIINTLGLTFLFAGYLLTTGTGVIVDSDIKNLFRIAAAALFLANVLLERSIRPKYLLALLALFLALTVSQSLIAANIVFLMLIAGSLVSLNKREAAIALIFPTLLVVGLHLLLLYTGQISSQVTTYGERLRSTLGFANANQASMIYLSLAYVSAYVHLLYRNRISAITVVASFIISYWAFSNTDSRTAFASLVMLIFAQAATLTILKFSFFRFWLVIAAYATPFVGIFITYYLVTSNDIDLNISLSLRPFFFSQFLQSVSLADFLFGWRVADDAGVDTAYLMLLSGVGAIGFFLLLISYLLSIRRMESMAVLLVMALMFSAIFESFLLRPEIPLSVLFVLLLSRAGESTTHSRVIGTSLRKSSL